jgi:hypothetical protein
MCSANRHVRSTPNRHAAMVMSALVPKADMCGALVDVCYGPEADIASLFDHLVSECE